ncbi:hypothetical protein X742_34970 [Mesorhizobium sp. LNHC232B00]|nr:hypothetical protein X742_34970 [Mesorhizobium sp. LNHC232B00]
MRRLRLARFSEEADSGTYLPLNLYASDRAISIDYAIMEKVSNIALVPVSFTWSDLGSWRSLLDSGMTDESGNVMIGDVVAVDCENSCLRSRGRLLSAIGLKNVAVVSTADANFVAPVAESQHVRRVVERLGKCYLLETKLTPSHNHVLLPALDASVLHTCFQ